MAFFKRKNEREESVSPFQLQREELRQQCLQARDAYRSKVEGLSKNQLSVKILEPNAVFRSGEYLMGIDGDTVSFLPAVPYDKTLDYVVQKAVENGEGEEYLAFMQAQELLRVDRPCIRVAVQGCGVEALPSPEFALVSKTKILPFALELCFSEGSGIEQAGCVKIQIANQPATIEKLNHIFPTLHLLSCYNVIEEEKKNAFKIALRDGSGLLSNDTFTVWREGDSVVFLRFKRGQFHYVLTAKLPLDIVEYYRAEGEITYENKISGGGGGGSNYGRALVGGMLFGAAGAIVASRNEVDEIRSERIAHDNRVTVMSLFVENRRHRIVFEKDAIDAFHRIMPEKDYDTLPLHGQNSAPAGSSPKDAPSIPEQIQQLAQLKDMGALTEAEFAEAKQALLSKLKG